MASATLATPGRWLDTDFPLSQHVVDAVAAQGYRGIARYVPLPHNSSVGDASAAEVERIVGAGLECLLVQHVRGPGLWNPAHHDGAEDARAAIAAAVAAGYPLGAHIFLDFEAISGEAFAATAFAVAWQTETLEAGYRAGLYVGYSVPLHPVDLYNLPGFDCYWSDAGKRQVATRGCAITQGSEITIAGVAFDQDILLPDQLGGVPWVASRAPEAPDDVA